MTDAEGIAARIEEISAEFRLDREQSNEADALQRLARAFALAAPLGSELHQPGDSHRYRVECSICGQRGVVNLSLEPQRVALAEQEPKL